MTDDAAHAETLRRHLEGYDPVLDPDDGDVRAAIERSIELLEMEVHGRFMKRGENDD